MNNSIYVIQPYRWAGTWVFDDADKGLEKEPFVTGVPEIIDSAVKDIPNAETGFRLLFSARPFPGFSIKLTWVRTEFDGNWYRTEDGREGWLCPAMLLYFDEPPKELYAKCEAIQG